jgi:hypothetical protein
VGVNANFISTERSYDRGRGARATSPKAVFPNHAVVASFSSSFDRGLRSFLDLLHPFSGSVFGFEQLLHRHGLVDVVLGSRDSLAGDQETHIRLHRILRATATSSIKLGQRELRGW